jgi:alpha-beta hydrolase superfamily lysophospholipase
MREELPVVMVRHSMGGLIAIRYAERHPEELDKQRTINLSPRGRASQLLPATPEPRGTP